MPDVLDAPQTVTVQPGETLSAIAIKSTGRASDWPRIYEMNKDKIGPNPDMIHPGMVLVVPGRG